jgi:hypothetical protein
MFGPGHNVHLVDNAWGEPKFGASIENPSHYHMAPQSARQSILQHGLDWTHGGGITDQYENQEGGNYLFPYTEGYPDEKWWGKEMQHLYGEPYDVWHVDAAGLPLKADSIGASYSPAPIPANRLRLRTPDGEHVGSHIDGTDSEEDQDFYHFAPTSERARIQTHGLIPAPQQDFGMLNENWEPIQQPTGVYVTRDPQNFSRTNFLRGKMDLWKVPSDQIKQIQDDPMVEGAYVIPHPVRAELHEPYESTLNKWGAYEYPLPEVVEGQRPAEHGLFYQHPIAPSRIDQRPVVWHHPTDTIYVGQPNTHHADVIDEHGLDKDDYQDLEQMTVEDSPFQWTSDEIGGPEDEHLQHMTYAMIQPSMLDPNQRRLRTWGHFSEFGKRALIKAGLLDDENAPQENWQNVFSKVGAEWDPVLFRWIEEAPKINVVHSQLPGTDSAYDETGDLEFRKRHPVVVHNDTAYVGNAGDTHSDVIAEHNIPHGSYAGWLPNGGFTKEPGSLTWFDGRLKPEWQDAVHEALRAEPEKQSWDQIFSKVAKETPNQIQARWEALNAEHPNTAVVDHNLSNGWTVQKLRSRGDVNRTGKFMLNCWQGRQALFPKRLTEDSRYYTMNDENGHPRVAFNMNPYAINQNVPFWSRLHPDQSVQGPAIIIKDPLGVRNRRLQPDHADLFREWANAKRLPLAVEWSGTPAYFDHPTVQNAYFSGEGHIFDGRQIPGQNDFERQAKEDVRAKPQKCKECKKPAIKSLVWAEGMAYVPVCADHEQSMRKHLKDEDGEGAFQEVAIRKEAKETLPQQLRRWQDLNASLSQKQAPQNEVVHQFPNGWTVQKLNTGLDVNRAGTMMRNCWQGRGFNDTVSGQHRTLNDEHGIPRVAFFDAKGPFGTVINQPLAARNFSISPEHYDMLKEYGDSVGSHVHPFEHYNSMGMNYLGAIKTAADMFTCNHCGSHAMTEPKQLGNQWTQTCTVCGRSRNVPATHPLINSLQGMQPAYPALLNEVGPERAMNYFGAGMSDGGPSFVWHDAGEMDPGRGKDYQADHSMLYDPATDTVHIGTEPLQHADLYDRTGNNPSFIPAYVYDGEFGSHRMDDQTHDRLYNVFNRIHRNTFGEDLGNRRDDDWGNVFSSGPQHSLVWEPGWPGKGIYHNGELTTWGTNSNRAIDGWPHHVHMWNQRYPDQEVDIKSPNTLLLNIEPEGQIREAHPFRGEWPNELYDIEPRFKRYGEEPSWETAFK